MMQYEKQVLLVALRARPSLRGDPPPPLPPPTPLLLLLQTSLLMRTSGLLLLVRSGKAARARVAMVAEVAAAVVEVAAGVVVGAAVEVVGVAGLVEGVGALVAAVEAAVGVSAMAAVGLVGVGLALGVLVLEVASVSSTSVGARPSHPSSFVSGFCVGRLGVVGRIAEGDCYRCVPPDPGIADAALGASESGTLPGTAPAQALHTFTLDSNASRCFFRDNTTLTPLPSPILICTCTRTGRHLATFTRRPGSSLYTLATEPPQVAASAQVSASGQVATSCSCRLLTHQTLLWHHRLGHPSLPRLRGMHSRLLISGLPRSLPPLPPSPALPCLPCVEGRKRAAPHSSFPPTTATLQTLYMDVWGPARVSGQSRERYFLLVVDDYTRYTTVFPLRSKGQVVDVLIPWICTIRLQLHERFGQDLPVMRLHSDRGVMEVARTSMIHAAAPHFLWPFAVWGSRAFVRDTSADKLSPSAINCVFFGFVLDAPGWQFYHPTSRHVFSSQDVTFDELVPFYRLFPYRSAPPPPPPLFLALGSPLVDPLPPQSPAPSGVSQVDPLPDLAPVQVAVNSSAARGAASGGAEPRGAESEGVGSGGAEPRGEEPGGAEPVGVEPEGSESGGAESDGAEPGGVEPRGAALSGAGGAGGTAGASGTGGTAATGPGGARTRGTGAAGGGGAMCACMEVVH
ncbi:unnamed protein product [Closterium sp. NIES-54]